VATQNYENFESYENWRNCSSYEFEVSRKGVHLCSNSVSKSDPEAIADSFLILCGDDVRFEAHVAGSLRQGC